MPNVKKNEKRMTVDQGLRGVAGTFILASLLLAHFVHPGFFFFTAFVGLNLLQSAFTRWCPMMLILRKAGMATSEAHAHSHHPSHPSHP